MRGEIAASWRRSELSGVAPDRLSPPYEEVDTETRFLRTAVPVLAGMAESLVGTDTCLAVSDPHGRILWRWVENPGLLQVLDRHSVSIGFRFEEEQVGTNGLGTALETGQAMLVRGGEHFTEALRVFTCAAAPVRHPVTRRVLGALNVTCRAEHTSPLLRPTLLRLVAEVQQRLLDDGSAQERLLLDGYLTERSRGGRPVISLNEDVFIANQAATRLDLDQALLWDGARAAIAGRQSRFTVPGNERLEASCRPVRDGASVVGAVVVLRETDAAPGEDTALSWADVRDRAAHLLGSHSVLLVRGEPGVGKTTLLRETLGDDVEVLDGAPPYGRLRSPGALVIRHVDELPASAVRALLDEMPAAGRLGLTTNLTHAGRGLPPDLAELLAHPQVTIPPLRRRAAEIRPLVESLLDERVWFTSAALDLLCRHPWPGNARQLVRVVSAAAGATAAGPIGPGQLPAELRTPEHRLSPLQEAEARVIATILDECGGNKTAAAARLQLSRTSLYQKLRAYKITA